MKSMTILCVLVSVFLSGCLEIVPDEQKSVPSLDLVKQDVLFSSDGQKLYVNVGNLGLDIIDVSDSHHPELLKNYAPDDYTYALAKEGSMLFMAEGRDGVRIVDVGDPNFIKQIAYFDTGEDNATCVALSPDLGRAVIGTDKGIQILDISNLQSPKYLGRYDSNGTIRDIAFGSNPDILFLANFMYGLEVVDISFTSHPVRIGAIAMEGSPVDLKKDLTPSYLHVATLTSAVKYVNISDPEKPEITRVNDAHDGSVIWDMRQSIDGQRFYMAKGNKGLGIFTFNDAVMTQIGSYDTNGTARGIGVSARENTAYIADGVEGLKIFDITEKTTPKRVGILLF